MSESVPTEERDELEAWLAKETEAHLALEAQVNPLQKYAKQMRKEMAEWRQNYKSCATM